MGDQSSREAPSEPLCFSLSEGDCIPACAQALQIKIAEQPQRQAGMGRTHAKRIGGVRPLRQ